MSTQSSQWIEDIWETILSLDDYHGTNVGALSSSTSYSGDDSDDTDFTPPPDVVADMINHGGVIMESMTETRLVLDSGALGGCVPRCLMAAYKLDTASIPHDLEWLLTQPVSLQTAFGVQFVIASYSNYRMEIIDNEDSCHAVLRSTSM